MAPWVSVILPLHTTTSSDYAKIILPIDALKVLDATKWCWIPQLGDAVADDGNRDTLLIRAGINNRPEVDILNNVWNFVPA